MAIRVELPAANRLRANIAAAQWMVHTIGTHLNTRCSFYVASSSQASSTAGLIKDSMMDAEQAVDWQQLLID
ncbi:hypothetical protein D3C84_999500 [compost metagenome]